MIEFDVYISKQEYNTMAKTNLNTLAYNSIRQKIVACEYAPGTFLNEEFLTEDLNLSRTPVRDALGRLEQEGLIQIRPKRGIMVTGLSINDINMIFEMRMLYEPYVILNYGSLMPEKKLAEFYNIFCNTKINENFAEKKDYYYDLDTDFHSMIIHSCPNIYIHQNYNLISTQDIRFRHMTGDCSVSRLEETFKEHLAIITPCIQKNWEEAAEKMRIHIQESKKAAFNLVFTNNVGMMTF